MKHWKWPFVSYILLIGLILAACSGAPTTVDKAPDAGAGGSDVVQPPVAPEPEDDQVVPRQSLEATDPTSVNLAAGKPTLVEFFAFW